MPFTEAVLLGVLRTNEEFFFSSLFISQITEPRLRFTAISPFEAMSVQYMYIDVFGSTKTNLSLSIEIRTVASSSVSSMSPLFSLVFLLTEILLPSLIKKALPVISVTVSCLVVSPPKYKLMTTNIVVIFEELFNRIVDCRDALFKKSIHSYKIFELIVN